MDTVTNKSYVLRVDGEVTVTC